MKTRLLLLISMLILMLVILVSNCTNGGGSSYKKIMEKKTVIDPDGQINIVCAHGNIDISTHKGKEILLTALVKSDSKIDPDDIVINLESNNKSFNILPGTKPPKPGISTDYILEVPEGLPAVHLTARSGDIRAKGVYKQFEMKTVNGRIIFQGEFTGSVFTSANGNMDVRVTDTLKGDMTARSTNGSVTLALYPDSGFRVNAQTVGGTVQNDFEIPVKKDRRGLLLSGTVNNGEYKIDINTVNGSIKLLKH
jgi:DUF4097 and DUF4098 domain-containing protein YvlB